MQYVNIRARKNDYALFEEEDKKFSVITAAQYRQIIQSLQVKANNRTYYNLYALDETQPVPDDYSLVSFVCRHSDGKFVRPELIDKACNRLSKEIEGLDGFHFHSLRHTFTSNLLAKGAAPKDVQELLGHSDVNLTMNVYAHAAKESKRNCVKLLDTLENGS